MKLLPRIAFTTQLSAQARLRRSLMLSRNRHWFGRFVIAVWAMLIVAFAFAEPDSVAADAMHDGGPAGYVLMGLLGLLSMWLLADSVMHDVSPSRFQEFLMVNRHLVTMAMAIVLTMEGGGLASVTHHPVLAAPFLLLAVFCGLVTYLDLYAINKERKQ